MAIAFSKYIDITSGVGGGAGVRQRDLILRIYTTNELVATGHVLEFTDLESVGTYFGTTSEEYKRASFYFGWISKNITKANKISFARWADVATKPQIFGEPEKATLNQLKAITAGDFYIGIGGTPEHVSALDFSAATSFADVAASLQTKIRALSNAQFTTATVTYDAIRKSFDFEGTTAGVAALAVSAGTVNDASALLGWTTTGAIVSDGVAVETVTDVLTASTNLSNNFASFLFTKALSIEQVTEAATWNDAQNNMFIFCVPVLDVNASNYYTALVGKSGSAVTLSEVSGQYPEMIPAMVLAATAYEKVNSVQNYMFQTFDLSASVTDTTKSNAYDLLRVNYYGQTQTAGQPILFYQRGIMMGGLTDATDQNTYANEIWLKDAAGAQLMSLFMALPKISANATGRAQLTAALQSVIDRALSNGVISVGKPLNTTQKLYIAQITDDDLAWHQVQNLGYWFSVSLESYVTQDSRTEWKGVYTLVYAKDDVIRSIEGSHIMI